MHENRQKAAKSKGIGGGIEESREGSEGKVEESREGERRRKVIKPDVTVLPQEAHVSKSKRVISIQSFGFRRVMHSHFSKQEKHRSQIRL